MGIFVFVMNTFRFDHWKGGGWMEGGREGSRRNHQGVFLLFLRSASNLPTSLCVRCLIEWSVSICVQALADVAGMVVGFRRHG